MINLLKKKTSEPVKTDEIPDRICKRLHLVYFTVKWIIIGFLLLLVIGAIHKVIGLVLGVNDIREVALDNGIVRHEYCGTFFVELNRENSFASEEAYNAYIERTNAQSSSGEMPSAFEIAVRTAGGVMLILLAVLHFTGKRKGILKKRIVMLSGIFIGSAMTFFDIAGGASLMLFLLLLLALRSGEKKTIFSDCASEYFIYCGILWFVGNIAVQVKIFLNTAQRGDGMIGVFSQPQYYLQLYNIAVVPVLIFFTGLMLSRHEHQLKKMDTGFNTKLLKITGSATLICSLCFTLYRMGIRSYELIRVMSGEEYSVKLPFTVMDNPYNRLIELPYGLAKTPQDYQNTILFRYIKDFPVAVLSMIAVVFFVRVIFNFAKGELNTVNNNRYLNIAMIVLLAASLWLNLMGIKELDFFNNGFTGIFGKVIYTIALRSMTEPALYAVVLWFFKTYMQAIPPAQCLRSQCFSYIASGA